VPVNPYPREAEKAQDDSNLKKPVLFKKKKEDEEKPFKP
jgi:hypothetical protein